MSDSGCICRPHKQNPKCPVKDTTDCVHHFGNEPTLIELEDEEGAKEIFTLINEFDFERKHFCIMRPPEQTLAHSSGSDGNSNAAIVIMEFSEGHFMEIEPDPLANRLFDYLDSLLGEEEDEKV